MRSCSGLESSILPLAAPHSSRTPELKLLRALIDRCAGSSPPSQEDVQKGLENGVARLMLLQGRLRGHGSRATGTRSSEDLSESHGLGGEIQALRDAVAELRAHTNSGEPAPLAEGFVVPREQ